MSKIDWSYHRPGCTTCKRTQAYLTKNKVSVVEEVNATKSRLAKSDALDLVKQARELFVAKGKSFQHINLVKAKPSDAELEKLIVGPTGNLRAPTLRIGKKLIVGFHEEMYREAGL